MNVTSLIDGYRRAAFDRVYPYFTEDEDVIYWLNEAQDEAVTRGRLIYEASNPAICQIPVVAGTASYSLHASIYELAYCAFALTGQAERVVLPMVSEESLDSGRITLAMTCSDNGTVSVFSPDDWRSVTGTPIYAVQNDKGLRLVPTPDESGTVFVEGYRMPIATLSAGTDIPEINAIHHRHLIDWVLYRAFSTPDVDLLDPNKAAAALDSFNRYFGKRPDSDLRRITREDVPHHNVAIW